MAALMLANVRKEKIYRKSDHLSNLTDSEIQSRYRFSTNGINFLCNLLEEELERPTKRGHAMSVEDQILVTLRYLATGNFLQVIGDTMGYDKSCVSRTIDRVVGALMDAFQDFVVWPSEEEKKKIKRKFFEMRRMPGVVGCIDGTHVRIQAPSRDEASFVNRKGYHSINIQAVCDSEGK